MDDSIHESPTACRVRHPEPDLACLLPDLQLMSREAELVCVCECVCVCVRACVCSGEGEAAHLGRREVGHIAFFGCNNARDAAVLLVGANFPL